MRLTRREFLQQSGAVAAAGLAITPRLPLSRRPLTVFDPTAVRALAMTALTAATAAGAQYADVRITLIKRWEVWESTGWGWGVTNTTSAGAYGTRSDSLAIGVRVLAGGGWGFSSTTIWTPDEAARVGKDAVRQARTLARPGTAPVELAAASRVVDGEWSTPIERDPFVVSREEILDTITGTSYYTLRRWGTPTIVASVMRQESAFASSEGSYLTQVRYQAGAKVITSIRPEYDKHQFTGHRPQAAGYLIPLAGRGWEYLGRAPWHQLVERQIAEQEEYLALPIKPVEVGRYDVVLDPSTAARLLSSTIGVATELDRALGYEANATGTSYLSDPVAMLGREQIGAPLLNVVANRSLNGGLATAKWDDEGVETGEIQLVKDGILNDFLTTRDSAPTLKDAYTRLGRPTGSRGCAGGAGALDVTQLQRPNLRVVPGAARADIAELMGRMGNGIVVEEAIADVDFNGLNGLARIDTEFPIARFYEVKRGKKVARLNPAATAVLFRAPEMWKSVVALGGAGSVRPTAVKSLKGEPSQETWHTVETPPMLLRQMAVIDPTR